MSDKPVETFRAGSVSASVFVNKGEKGEMLNISLSKSYKKGDEWKRTNSLGVNDIPKAILCLNEAYKYTFSRKKEAEPDTPF